ncbi:MAG: DUF4386 family protein [Anaerolineales bacterium]|jgi:hypothetical protein|nr:DUF4386 family protein [Anaerolineales bacterium]
MMKNLQKMGGIAALYIAAVYVVIFVVFIFLMDYLIVVDPVQQVALIADNQAIMYIMNLIMFVAVGIFLVVLALALYERLKAGSPAIMQIATAIGLIWACLLIGSGMVANSGIETVVDLYGKDPAQAVTVMLAIEPVADGLGCEFELPGSLWVLLISWTALRAGGLPKALNYLGVVLAVAGILTVFPAAREVARPVFALGQLVWFMWLGIVMLRGRTSAAA